MNKGKSNKAYLLLSGGQDSFVCLLWGMDQFATIETISISYGQRHKKELEYAIRIAAYFGVKHTVYNIGDFLKNIAPSSLLGEGNHTAEHALADHLPASFVPNRNGLFLTIAANHAYMQKESQINLITGTCETDYSGYPDCRNNYIKSKALELSLGLDVPVNIYTPLMWVNKATTFRMAWESGKLNEINELTLTCYEGNETLNDWGRGCGECPSCKLRAKGFMEFQTEINAK